MFLEYENKKTEQEIIEKYKNKRINIDNDFENLLFEGDNLKLLSSIAFNDNLSHLKDIIKCIYIDPPFAKKTTFKDRNGTVAYEDNSIGSDFIEELRERFVLSKKIMNNGFIFVHSDHTIGHYLKVIMDEVFGINNFMNEIVTGRVKKNDSNAKKLNVDYDHVYVYKIGNPTAKPLYIENKKKKPYWHSLDAKGQGKAKMFFGKEIEPPAGTHWRWSQERIDKEIKNGTLKLNSKSKPVYLVTPKPVKIGNNWTDICCYSFGTKYPTEKSVEFLSRVIEMSTEEDDMVIDFYGGSGSTAYTAMLKNRKYITADKGTLALEIMRKRLKNYKFIDGKE